MSRAVVWAPSAQRDLSRLDRDSRERIIRSVLLYAATDYGDVKKLVGVANELRLRVGKWRVRFELSEEKEEMHVLRVLPRAEAYR